MPPILTHRPSDDMLFRLRDLAPDQIEAGLMWLAGYDPEVFCATLVAARTWGSGSVEEAQIDWVPYCAVCGARIGIFAAQGDDYRHRGGQPRIVRGEPCSGHRVASRHDQ